MLPTKGIIFLTLNAVRLLSLLASLFVFTGTILLMTRDSNGYAHLRKDGTLHDAKDEFEYLPDTAIPTITWGLFWSQLAHISALAVCFVFILCDVSVGIVDDFFRVTIPILGPTFSTTPLGLVQMFVSSMLLSRYNHGFPLFAPWMLFFVGALNVIFGVIFGVRGKWRRSVFRSKRDMLERAKGDVEQAVPFGLALRTLAKTGIAEVGRMKESRKSAKGAAGRSQGTDEKEMLLPSSYATRPVRTATHAFHGQSTYDSNASPHSGHACSTDAVWPPVCRAEARSVPTHDDVLRWRARQENLQAERRQEEIEQNGGGKANVASAALSKHFAWNAKHDIVVPRRTTASNEHAISALLNELGVQESSPIMVSKEPVSPSPRVKGYRRRTLVLSKMVANVKRSSSSAMASVAAHVGARKTATTPVTPRVPGSYRRTGVISSGGIRTGEAPGPWVAVEGAQSRIMLKPPPPSYRPTKDRVYSDKGDEGNEGEEEKVDDHHSRYMSLPVAERFATT